MRIDNRKIYMSVVLSLLFPLLLASPLAAQPIEEPNPDKPLPAARAGLELATTSITYNQELINTPFTDGDGIQGSTDFRNIGDPATWEYYSFCGDAGDTVVIEVHRTTSAMDPAMMVCFGTTDDSTGIWAFGDCGPDMTYVASADDNNGIPHGVGGWYYDPRIEITLPSTGEYTLMIFDYIGMGTGMDPEPLVPFEIHVSGIGSCGCSEQSWTYTADADFAQGTLVNVNYTDVPDQLQLDSVATPFEFIWVAASGRGTIIKIDTVTGAILGEYWSAPQNMNKNPSRTTVDGFGNVWAGNRDEAGGGKGSVVKIGLLENGQCVDRDGSGTIETSTGLGNIRPWPNTGGEDTNGGVSTAQDECIINYVRTAGTNVRTVAVTQDGSNDVWFGGLGNRVHQRHDSAGVPNSSTFYCGGAGGYGGLVDEANVLWSASAGTSLLRLDPASSPSCSLFATSFSYGLARDSSGRIWNTQWTYNRVYVFNPTGVLAANYSTGDSGSRGIAATADDNMWIANSYSNTVTRLTNGGTLLATIPVGNHPTGVAVDDAGKVWVTNYYSSDVMRIDPGTNAVDLTVSLGGGASPYNYSDMTGSTLIAPPDGGTWTVVHDSGIAGAKWRGISWNSLEPGDSSITVKVASSTDGTTFGPEVAVSNGDDPYLDHGLAAGQYLKVIVSFTRASTGETPILYDLTIRANQPPIADANGSYTVGEGDSVTLDGTASSDPDCDDLTYEWDLDNDGTFDTTGAEPTFEGLDGPSDHTVVLRVCDPYGDCATDSTTVHVNNVAPTVTVDITEQTVQYSDEICDVTFTATDVAADTMTAATTPDPLPESLTLTDNGCTTSDGVKTCTWTLAGTMDQPVDDYDITVTVTDDDGGSDSDDTTITVVHEDADIWLDGDNPVAVEVDSPGGDSPPFSLTAYVQETSDPDAADCGADPGDINNAELEMTLEAVGPGGSYTGMCTAQNTPAGDDYDAILEVRCDFDDVEVNTYHVQASVDGDYYAGGPAEDVLVVYDPSLGFTTGGGWFYWPDTSDKTNFGYTMKYNKKATKVQGSLLLIRHLDDGTGRIYRVKSNALYGLALGESADPAFGWASFSGKCTYKDKDWLEPEGNYEFLVYVEDWGEPGAGVDQFWIEVRDRDGNVIGDMSLDREAVDHTETLGGGNIVVPHTPGSLTSQ